MVIYIERKQIINILYQNFIYIFIKNKQKTNETKFFLIIYILIYE